MVVLYCRFFSVSWVGWHPIYHRTWYQIYFFAVVMEIRQDNQKNKLFKKVQEQQQNACKNGDSTVSSSKLAWWWWWCNKNKQGMVMICHEIIFLDNLIIFFVRIFFWEGNILLNVHGTNKILCVSCFCNLMSCDSSEWAKNLICRFWWWVSEVKTVKDILCK